MSACLAEVSVIYYHVNTILNSITLTFTMHAPSDFLILNMHALHLVQVPYHVSDAWSSNAWSIFLVLLRAVHTYVASQINDPP